MRGEAAIKIVINSSLATKKIEPMAPRVISVKL